MLQIDDEEAEEKCIFCVLCGMTTFSLFDCKLAIFFYSKQTKKKPLYGTDAIEQFLCTFDSECVRDSKRS